VRWPVERHSDRKRRERQRPGLTSLVDVVFLLLIFFLLAGSLQSGAPFEVVPPEGSVGLTLGEGPVAVWLAADGRVALGDEILAPESLVDRLSAVLPGSSEVRLTADARARARHLLPVLEALREAGAGEIELVVRDRS